MRTMCIGAVLLFAITGCKPNKKPVTPDAIASQVRMTVSLAAETQEFCSLAKAGKVRERFPGQHLEDVSKQLQETSDDLQKLEAQGEQETAKERLTQSQQGLKNALEEISKKSDVLGSDLPACDRLPKIVQQARSAEQQQ